jgi:hypothetical protein
VPTPQTVIQRNTDQINLNMKIFTLIALLLVVYCGRSQTGNISGNAFWKYNDYVGNKPDAASDVLLYRIDSPSIKRQNQCDVQGNFRFDNVPVGSYLLVIASHATNTAGADNIETFKIYKPYTKSVFGIDITTYPQYDSLAGYLAAIQEVSAKKTTAWNANKRMKENIDASHNYRMCCMRLWGQVHPADLDMLIAMGGFRKLFLKVIEVKPNENITAIADFGITSF